MARKKDTIRMRARTSGGATEILALIHYKIVSGLVRNKETKQFELKKPQRFVKTVTVSLNDKAVFTGNLSIGSSDDPFLGLKVKGGKDGDMVKVHWEDNQGDWDEISQPIKA
jgi:sulfur-oxidizing protein SoxZ